MLDTSILGNGKEGIILTDSKFYYSCILEKNKKIWYDEIEKINIVDEGKEKALNIYLLNKQEIYIYDPEVNIEALYNCLIELVSVNKLFNSTNIDFDYEKFVKHYYGSENVGRQIGNYGIVKRAIDEERIHGRQGHGFAAEQANTLYDNLTGKRAIVTGNDYEKDGPDRKIIKHGEELFIQTKYYKTGSGSINACFENNGKGKFRYYNKITGKPMQIEVPKDKWAQAVKTMQKKIANGQVQGVKDTNQAEEIVRKGHFTYQQAVNISKPWNILKPFDNIESITYDSVNGIISCGWAGGFSFAATFALGIWDYDDYNVVLKRSAKTGLKIGGTAYATTVLSGQLSKAGLNSEMVEGSKIIVKKLGKNFYTPLANAFKETKNISGTATKALSGGSAINKSAQVLRNSAIASIATFAVSSSFDITEMCRKRISIKQLLKNMINNGTTIGFSSVSGLAAAPLGPVGMLVVAILAGKVGSSASTKITNRFINDDSIEMIKILEKAIEKSANDYLLNKNETEKVIDALQEKLGDKALKDMYASKDRKKFAKEFVNKIVEEIIKNRKVVMKPNNEETYKLMLDIVIKNDSNL